MWRRSSIGQAGPLGDDFPLVTREGHHVLNVIFTSPILNLDLFLFKKFVSLNFISHDASFELISHLLFKFKMQMM